MHGSGTGEINYKEERKLTLYISAAAIYDVLVLSNQNRIL